ncbi:hypothetical protein L210DRAFT_3544841 [Boletus edulis BED1]|uniref:Uncharacterized protein n=1 Tax=Boletus edulis BED1 TaxID=1328754 RepID=A0AAD4BT48_BOLED|nr:hypothetical protein L210DRAFT_3544841 [Boletus edulis BED1]
MKINSREHSFIAVERSWVCKFGTKTVYIGPVRRPHAVMIVSPRGLGTGKRKRHHCMRCCTPE